MPANAHGISRAERPPWTGSPPWLDTGHLNYAIAGAVGVGKSSLVNMLCDIRANDEGAAPIDSPTYEPVAYHFKQQGLKSARLWDLPGAGAPNSPPHAYLHDMGLRHMDGVIIVCASKGFTEVDLECARLLRDKHVPCHLVRTKVDDDLARKGPEKEGPTLAAIRGALQAQAQGHKVLLVSAKDRSIGDKDVLLRCIEKDLRAHRQH
eukprot:gnl/MRDRNA2_/MRDRNA2_94852_c0_seq1.p1 gnl/MRDRNA2_/MRDRNA2_94852_c0~~gnl/MRDRNA2_/MRDRNA2_94852_c0_seq1.p1  ORF type:complete len:207 (+),score=30.92 gnl/MRDRNA2_/MRDRNA2_94852_c0_seq1:52-672(+)